MEKKVVIGGCRDYALKYLARSTSKALPWRASSRDFVCFEYVIEKP